MIDISVESAFQRAIEAAEQLSVDERLVLLDVLRQRIQQAVPIEPGTDNSCVQDNHQELLAELSEVRQEYRSGDVRFGSVSAFMSELDEL